MSFRLQYGTHNLSIYDDSFTASKLKIHTNFHTQPEEKTLYYEFSRYYSFILQRHRAND